MPDRGNALPQPGLDAARHSERLAADIRAAVAEGGGWMTFARYMELALYAPGLGYYAAGTSKLGAAGDFVTAPELSPLFGGTLARPVAAILRETGGSILEFGAGSGSLACALLAELDRLDALPERYAILEPSPDLRARQGARIGALPPSQALRVEWIDALPMRFRGVMLANEVVDAMPVHVVAWTDRGIVERGVAVEDDRFVWRDRALSEAGTLRDTASRLAVPGDYTSEIGLAARAWMRSVGAALELGAALVIDYGFPSREYYHPQRSGGTLMCHYRHRAHDDPLLWPGLQDITAHVDFSALADSAREAGLTVLGYASQAEALLSWGVLDLLGRDDAASPGAFLPRANAVQRLLSPAEMGELFKVLAVGRGISAIPGLVPNSAERL